MIGGGGRCPVYRDADAKIEIGLRADDRGAEVVVGVAYLDGIPTGRIRVMPRIRSSEILGRLLVLRQREKEQGRDLPEQTH